MLKGIYRKFTIIIFNGEQPNAFFKIGKKAKMFVLLFLMNIVLVILASVVGKTKGREVNHTVGIEEI